MYNHRRLDEAETRRLLKSSADWPLVGDSAASTDARETVVRDRRWSGGLLLLLLSDCRAAGDEYSEGMARRTGGAALEDLSFLAGGLAKSPTLSVVSRVALLDSGKVDGFLEQSLLFYIHFASEGYRVLRDVFL